MAFKTLFHCLAGLRGTHYARIVQNGTDAPVDVRRAVAAVKALLVRHTASRASPPVSVSEHRRSLP